MVEIYVDLNLAEEYSLRQFNGRESLELKLSEGVLSVFQIHDISVEEFKINHQLYLNNPTDFKRVMDSCYITIERMEREYYKEKEFGPDKVK